MSYEIDDDPKFDYIEYLTDEVKMTIIFSLDVYKSLNLRQIATILGISEPGAYKHVTSLLDKGIIQLDPSMAGKRGKYYNLHPKISPIIEEQEKIYAKKLETVDLDFYKIQALVLRSMSVVTQRFANYLSRYAEENAEEFVREYEKTKQSEPLVSTPLAFYASSVKVTNKEEENELGKVFKAAIEKMEEINERNKHITTGDAFEQFYFSHLIVPLKKIDPRD